MQIRIVAFTSQGVATTQSILYALEKTDDYEIVPYTLEKHCNHTGFTPMKEGLTKWTQEGFEKSEALIFVGATGIAVRAIAPFIKDKYTDPAVIVLDEKGDYIIPLLSGHIGGANRLARQIANSIQGIPIVSTATDINGLFAVDEWAYQKGLRLSDREGAKTFAAKLLAGEQIKVHTPFSMIGDLPRQMTMSEEGTYTLTITTSRKVETPGVQVIPPIITLGIGCRRGTSLEAIESLVLEALEQADICLEAVKQIATIDLKKDEEGLLAFGNKYGWPIQFFTSEVLEQVVGHFTPSDFVKRITQVDNVCERSAVAASGGRLTMKKKAHEGVTVALAQAPFRIEWNH